MRQGVGEYMDIKQLKRFLDLCETGSFTRTAENMFLSQQALSTSMNILEEELGRMLFKRTSKGVILTKEGKVLKELCTPLVQSFDDMTLELNRRFNNEKGHLVIGLAPGVLQASSPDMLLRFRYAYPNFDFRAIESPDTTCVDNVLNGAVDLAFCPRPHDESEIEYLPLREEKLCAVINRNSPLASLGALGVEDLKEEKLVSLNKYYQIYYKILDWYRLHGLVPDFAVESGEISILLSMVKMDTYVFICMDHIAQDMDKNSCVRVPIADDNFVWQYGIVYKKGKKLDHSAKVFIDFVNNNSHRNL